MKKLAVLTISLVLLFAGHGFSQKTGKTFFSVGANLLKSKDFRTYYDEECTPPAFLNLGVSHSWNQPSQRLTFNKEIGVNLQYSSPDLSSGGLGAHSYSKYKIFNLTAEATIQVQFKIDRMLSMAIGPVAEYLIAGFNKVNRSYYYLVDSHYINGEYNHAGFNRDYFGDPLGGIKLSVFNFGMSDKATFKINCSYFLLSQDDSNFHSSNFIKVGVAFGVGGKKSKMQRE